MIALEVGIDNRKPSLLRPEGTIDFNCEWMPAIWLGSTPDSMIDDELEEKHPLLGAGASHLKIEIAAI